MPTQMPQDSQLIFNEQIFDTIYVNTILDLSYTEMSDWNQQQINMYLISIMYNDTNNNIPQISKINVHIIVIPHSQQVQGLA